MNLIGDIKSGITDAEVAQEFLVELELLMLRYKIDKVDMCWKKFKEIIED